MNVISKSPKTLLMLALLAGPASGSLAQQPQDLPGSDRPVTVYGSPSPEASPEAAEMTAGPAVEGIISARSGDNVQVTTADGTKTVIAINDGTRIKASGGFLGLNRSKLAADSLLNGLPVTVKTLQSGSGLVASQIDLKNKDLKTASMIRNGTDQRFGEQGTAIAQNAAATEALRGRMGDIDQYNIKRTTNVHFDTGKAALSPEDEAELCATAAEAEQMDNALLLVVGYTDSTGSQEFNQTLSEKRAGRVINYLQQACGWKPYRVLTPTGMAEADPAASNDTAEGKAQNRRVAVNILVSKAVDGL
jgi:outer membrane protein OmpA-like peptidoglycan-associated protein